MWTNGFTTCQWRSLFLGHLTPTTAAHLSPIIRNDHNYPYASHTDSSGREFTVLRSCYVVTSVSFNPTYHPHRPAALRFSIVGRSPSYALLLIHVGGDVANSMMFLFTPPVVPPSQVSSPLLTHQTLGLRGPWLSSSSSSSASTRSLP